MEGKVFFKHQLKFLFTEALNHDALHSVEKLLSIIYSQPFNLIIVSTNFRNLSEK